MARQIQGFGKNVAIFYWEWGRNSAPGEGQKIPCTFLGEPVKAKDKLSCQRTQQSASDEFQCSKLLISSLRLYMRGSRGGGGQGVQTIPGKSRHHQVSILTHQQNPIDGLMVAHLEY